MENLVISSIESDSNDRVITVAIPAALEHLQECKISTDKFVVFLNRCLPVLEGRLSSSSGVDGRFALSLLNLYRLCLEYADCLPNNPYLLKRNVLRKYLVDYNSSIPHFVARECQVQKETGIEYVKLVSFCVNGCDTADADSCSIFAAYLNKASENFWQVRRPISMILGLYAAGLLLSSNLRLSDGDHSSSFSGDKFQYLVGKLPDNEKIIQNLTLSNDQHTTSKMKSVSLNARDKDFAKRMSMELDAYLPHYLDALEVFSNPLVESINSEEDELVDEKDDASVMPIWSTVLDAFHLLCNLIAQSERDMDRFDYYKIVIKVAFGALTLSFKSKTDIKRSLKLAKEMFTSEWIRECGRVYKDKIITNLERIASALNLNNKKIEASKVMNLCCKASWCFIKSESMDQLGNGFVEIVESACKRSAYLISGFHFDIRKLRKRVKYILGNWCAAKDCFEGLAAPKNIVTKFVVEECKHAEQEGQKDSAPTLSSLLSSFEIKKESIGMLLEQELTAYEKESFTHREFCCKMQLKIIDILLKDGYENTIPKARTLVRKGKALRVSGLGLESIECFSEAITSYKEEGSVRDHELAVAYCLHALCMMEYKPHSKVIFNNVKTALDLWLSWLGRMTSDCYDKEEYSAMSSNTIMLLYTIFDLVQLKGFNELFANFYKLVIEMFKMKDVAIGKWLPNLWEGRRLSCALCLSPIHEEIAQKLSHEFDELSNFGSWTNYFQDSQPLVIGFQQNFPFVLADFPSSPDNDNDPCQSDTKIDHIKKVADDLISKDLGSKHSKFLAGYLYFDLCPILVSNGRLIEALACAKEAQRLRSELYNDTFIYDDQHHTKRHKKTTGDRSNIITFELKKKVAREVFFYDCSPPGEVFNNFYLSPWKIVQCYLESIIQVAILQEMIGSVAEAETVIQGGKNISYGLDLPIFEAAVSLIKGKLFCKKGEKESAQKELDCSSTILKSLDNTSKNSPMSTKSSFCCRKCQLIFEATLDQYFGDLAQIRAGNSGRNAPVTVEKKYKSALAKLNNSVWENSLKCLEDDSDKSETNAQCVCKSLQEGSGNQKRKREKGTNFKKIGCSGPSMSGVTSNYNKMRCWFCLLQEVLKSGKLINLILLKWEFVRRQLSLKLHTKLGRFVYPKQPNEEQKFRLRISILASRNSLDQKRPPIITQDYFCNLVAKKIPGDPFAIERAEILLELCWFFLENTKHLRDFFDDLDCIKIEDLASWLMLAFVLSREVPALFQKVSTLLAVMYIVSGSKRNFSLPTFTETLDASHWASFFHQASIGTQCAMKFEVQGPVHEFISNLAVNVKKFFIGLPSATVVNISLLRVEYTGLLKNLLDRPRHSASWMLVSRFSSKSEPVVMLCPVDSISQDDAAKLGSLSNLVKLGKPWRPTWDSTVVDDVAPTFKRIWEVNSSIYRIAKSDKKKHFRDLWDLATNLDGALSKLLRDIEDSWFGIWKCLLLGELSNKEKLDSVKEQLVRDLGNLCRTNVNETLLRVILGGMDHNCDGNTWISQQCSKKGCYIAKVGFCDEAMSGIMSNAANTFGTWPKKASNLLNEASNKLKVEQSREPVILVLDYDIQMLPWESLPALRNQEVYRMPTVGNIIEVLERNQLSFPRMDPYDGYYLLYPDGDARGLQSGLKDLFITKELKGKAESIPTVKELVDALTNHDFFIYVGHGSGKQYISDDQIQELENCAAAMLMGCSTGSLELKESHRPRGTHLSYLLAGSPVVIATLWNVNINDINLLASAILKPLFQERSKLSIEGPRNCDHSPKIGSFICKAREACTFRFLTGASAVCYGVPTKIYRKEGNQAINI